MRKCVQWKNGGGADFWAPNLEQFDQHSMSGAVGAPALDGQHHGTKQLYVHE